METLSAGDRTDHQMQNHSDEESDEVVVLLISINRLKVLDLDENVLLSLQKDNRLVIICYGRNVI